MRVLPFLVFGSICVIFGMTVYYFLPSSLLTQNAQLLLQIFFFILLGLIIGLTLLAVNLRGFIEKVLIYVLFFWERSSMRTLIRKNLIAHKKTNKLTSVIYALTLGCIIFLIEAANLQIVEIRQLSSVPGVDVEGLAPFSFISPVTGECQYFCLTPENVDPVLLKYKDKIKHFAWTSKTLALQTYQQYGWAGTSISDLSRMSPIFLTVYGWSPSALFDDAM